MSRGAARRGGLERGHRDRAPPDGAAVRDQRQRGARARRRGRIIARVAMFWDVTEERRTERQLRDVQRIQAVGTLAGGVAHEINNQMTAVSASAPSCCARWGPIIRSRPTCGSCCRRASGRRASASSCSPLPASRSPSPRLLDLPGDRGTSCDPVLQQLLGADKLLQHRAGVTGGRHGQRRPGRRCSRSSSTSWPTRAMPRRPAPRSASRSRTSRSTRRLPAPLGESRCTRGAMCRLSVADTGTRHGSRHARADLRSVLHHEGAWARAPGWGCRWCTAPCGATAATSWAHSAPGRGHHDGAVLAGVIRRGRASRGTGGERRFGAVSSGGWRRPAASSGGGGRVRWCARSPCARCRRKATASSRPAIGRGRGSGRLLERDAVRPDIARHGRHHAAAERPGAERCGAGALAGDGRALHVRPYRWGEVLERLVPPGAPFLQKPFAPEALAQPVGALRSRMRQSRPYA